MIIEQNREFEIPYNFDISLINMLKILDSSKNSFINCIYLPPYIHDYQTILRNPQQANLILNMTRKEYERHI